MTLPLLCPLQIMTSAWPSLAFLAPVDATTSLLAASAVTAIRASLWTAQAAAVKAELGFGWHPGLGGRSEGPWVSRLSLSVLKTWTNVLGPIAASMAVRMSQGATTSAALRVSPTLPVEPVCW